MHTVLSYIATIPSVGIDITLLQTMTAEYFRLVHQFRSECSLHCRPLCHQAKEHTLQLNTEWL